MAINIRHDPPEFLRLVNNLDPPVQPGIEAVAERIAGRRVRGHTSSSSLMIPHLLSGRSDFHEATMSSPIAAQIADSTWAPRADSSREMI
jgi:hypothetical protein